MCEICVELCKAIEEVFGHQVDPMALAELIESSPLPVVHTPEPKRNALKRLLG